LDDKYDESDNKQVVAHFHPIRRFFDDIYCLVGQLWSTNKSCPIVLDAIGILKARSDIDPQQISFGVSARRVILCRECSQRARISLS